MKPVVFRGSGCALITPMTQDGEIRYDVFEKLIEFQINNGTSALIICATTGESPTLTDVEYASLIRFSKETAKGRVPVIVGCGGNSTDKTAEKCRLAEKLGADALLSVTPYYNLPTQRGLLRHFRTIARATSLPIILYDVPKRTGVSFEPETVSELVKVDNIVAFKAASHDLSKLLRIKSLCGDEISIYSGSDELTAPIFSLGGIGAISVAANLCPKEFSELCDAGLRGNLNLLTQKQLELSHLLQALSHFTNPIAIKEAMNLSGIPVGKPRPPLCELSDQERAFLSHLIDGLKIDIEGYFS